MIFQPAHVRIYQHEGMTVYQDESMPAPVPILGAVACVYTVPTVDGRVHTHARTIGLYSPICEAVAAWLVNNPGMKDAVDGLYELLRMKRDGGR